MKAKAVPEAAVKEKEKPIVGTPENTIIVAGKPIEIKPTKLRYIRNGTVNLYPLLKNVSLINILQIPSGSFGPDDDRDGDKAVMDFLIAVTDDEAFVSAHYDEFDAEQIIRLVEIFERVNKFPKEDNSKNATAPAV